MANIMESIFLHPEQLAEPLTLKPAANTLYVLPPNISDVSVTLTLLYPGVRAFLIGLFQTEGEQKITINQHHVATHTESHILLKSLVAPQSHFHYRGNIHIDKAALHSNASQEARGLLTGAEARFQAFPSLEIIPKESRCRHQASSGPISQESLFVLQTKGFTENEARSLLETAFLRAALDTLSNWNLPKETIETALQKITPSTYVL